MLRHLPREFQRLPIYVTPEAGLRYWGALGKVDPLLLRMVRELVFPGAAVWDVGANVGLFAFSAAAVAGPSGSVLAIEPDIYLAQLLNRSAQRIALTEPRTAEVKILCAAVSSECGVRLLEIAERARASNRLQNTYGGSQTGSSRQLQPTTSVTLDSLLDSFAPPNVLKIDVEAHEAEVFRGATRLLEVSRPLIWCEVDPANAEKVSELLGQRDYRLFGAAEMPHPLITKAWWNTLAVPAEKLATCRTFSVE